MTRQTHGEKIRLNALRVGVELWEREGAKAVTSRRIGDAIGRTRGAIAYHFKTAQGLLDAVADEAVRVGCRGVIIQLIAINHPAVKSMTPGDRRAYLRSAASKL